jgi:hypothetical protein
METVTLGVVKNGVIVPNIPLPEGAWVEIRVQGVPLEVPPDLQEELEGWKRASAQALELMDRVLEEDEKDENR